MSIRQDSIEDFDKGRESMRENVRENPKQSPQKRRKNEPKLTFNFD